jgi:hypothetical protein
MTIPTSSAPSVRQYFYDMLTAQLTPDPFSKTSSLLVCFDDPGAGQPDDIVAVGKTTSQVGVMALVGGGGAGWLDERYTLEIVVDVFRGGDDPTSQAAYIQASALCDSIIAVLRGDPSLGGRVLVAKPHSVAVDVEEDPAHMGRRATGLIEIECLNRI